MRSLRSKEHEPVLTIPPVARVVVVRVQPTAIVVTVDAEQVRVAIAHRAGPSVPPPLDSQPNGNGSDLSGMYCIRHQNALVRRAKVSRFLNDPTSALAKELAFTIPTYVILGSAERSAHHATPLPHMPTTIPSVSKSECRSIKEKEKPRIIR
jgi:hypothetical protein